MPQANNYEAEQMRLSKLLCLITLHLSEVIAYPSLDIRLTLKINSCVTVLSAYSICQNIIIQSVLYFVCSVTVPV